MIRSSDDDFQDALDCIAAGDFDEAIGLLAKVVAFDNSNVTAYELWVACHVEARRLARAIELAEAGLAKGISPAEMHVQKARAMLLSDRLDDASREAEAAMAIDPTSSGAVLTLVNIKLSLGEAAEAIRTCEEAVARNRDEEIEAVLLDLLMEAGRHDAVIDRARDFLRTHGRDADVLAMLGHAHAARSDFHRADRAFRNAAELEPEVVARHVDVLMMAVATRNDKAFEKYIERLAETDEELSADVAAEVQRILDEDEDEDEEPSTPEPPPAR